MRKRICLVTTGHPSTNPRLVKEADALVEVGYEVHVVACKFLSWADEADDQFRDRSWTISWTRFGEMAPPLQRQFQRARKKLAMEMGRRLGFPQTLNVRALHYVIPELARSASRYSADLYIAHNLGALPAAYAAARKHRARLGFDAEDYHRGEYPDGDNSLARQVTMRVEERYIASSDYVTAASDGIAEAYSRALGIALPTAILNVFPLSEREVLLSGEERVLEKPDGLRSLYWFSQTIGPGRGLEEVVRALPALEEDIVLSLRGDWATGYERHLMNLAREQGVADRIRILSMSLPQEMIVRAGCHDVGLALEPGRSENNRIAVSNKLFSYVIAGIPTVATATPGQLRLSDELGDAVAYYAPGDVHGAVDAVRQIGKSSVASARARAVAEERFNWDREKDRFLEVVDRVLCF